MPTGKLPPSFGALPWPSLPPKKTGFGTRLRQGRGVHQLRDHLGRLALADSVQETEPTFPFFPGILLQDHPAPWGNSCFFFEKNDGWKNGNQPLNQVLRPLSRDVRTPRAFSHRTSHTPRAWKSGLRCVSHPQPNEPSTAFRQAPLPRPGRDIFFTEEQKNACFAPPFWAVW